MQSSSFQELWRFWHWHLNVYWTNRVMYAGAISNAWPFPPIEWNVPIYFPFPPCHYRMKTAGLPQGKKKNSGVETLSRTTIASENGGFKDARLFFQRNNLHIHIPLVSPKTSHFQLAEMIFFMQALIGARWCTSLLAFVPVLSKCISNAMAPRLSNQPTNQPRSPGIRPHK